MANITKQNNFLCITGDLTFATVPNLWEQSLPLLLAEEKLNFNLEKISSSNSAGVALLLEWIHYAKKNHKKISFTAVPSQLLSILEAAGLGDAIPA